MPGLRHGLAGPHQELLGAGGSPQLRPGGARLPGEQIKFFSQKLAEYLALILYLTNLQHGERMHLKRLKLAIKYKQKRVS